MKQCVVVTYKNGTSINMDVPSEYYKNKYSKKSEKTRERLKSDYEGEKTIHKKRTASFSKNSPSN